MNPRMVWAERGLIDHIVPTSWHGQGHLSLDQGGLSLDEAGEAETKQ